MTTALEGGEWSAARPGRTLPPGKTRYPLYRRLGGHQGRSGQVRIISPLTGIRSPHLPALSQTLYRLRYPGPQVCVIVYYSNGLNCFWIRLKTGCVSYFVWDVFSVYFLPSRILTSAWTDRHYTFKSTQIYFCIKPTKVLTLLETCINNQFIIFTVITNHLCDDTGFLESRCWGQFPAFQSIISAQTNAVCKLACTTAQRIQPLWRV